MSASTYFTGSIEQRLSDDLHLAGVAERTRKGLRAVRQLAEHAKCSPDKIDEDIEQNLMGSARLTEANP